MRRALPLILLIALLATACSTAPTTGALDGPTATLTLATSGRSVGTLGVPFVNGQPVVTSVDVVVVALTNPPVPLRFTLADGVHAYDPDGDLTAVGFAFAEIATVTLPAGVRYGFATRGHDANDMWLAYGETLADVDATTTGVALALQTLIHAATLEGATSAIARDQTIDLQLGVTAPGGYAVPTADYSVSYAIASEDGGVVAASKLGAQVRAHATPIDDAFAVTATVTGWREIDGDPVWVDALGGVTATFTVPFTVPTGLAFDATAPSVTIVAPLSGTVGSPIALSGTAADDVALDRVQVYAGPVLLASSNAADAVGSVVLLELVNGTWSFGWTPNDVRAYTLTALAIDAAGNESRASTSVEIEEVQRTTLTFILNDGFAASAAVGETVLLSGPAPSGFTASQIELFYNDVFSIPTTGIEIAGGMWTLPWTVPSGPVFLLLLDYHRDYTQSFIELNY